MQKAEQEAGSNTEAKREHELLDFLENVDLNKLASEDNDTPSEKISIPEIKTPSTIEVKSTPEAQEEKKATEQPRAVIKQAPKPAAQSEAQPTEIVSPIDYEASFEAEKPEDAMTSALHGAAPTRHRRYRSSHGSSSRRSSSSGRRSKSSRDSSSGSKTLKIAIFACLSIVVVLASVIMVMMMRQSSLRASQKQAREDRAALLQMQAQKELRETNIGDQLKLRETNTEQATRQTNKRNNSAPLPLGESTLDYENSGNDLFNPNIFNLPSDTETPEEEPMQEAPAPPPPSN